MHNICSFVKRFSNNNDKMIEEMLKNNQLKVYNLEKELYQSELTYVDLSFVFE